jgi:hypothetical protein
MSTDKIAMKTSPIMSPQESLWFVGFGAPISTGTWCATCCAARAGADDFSIIAGTLGHIRTKIHLVSCSVCYGRFSLGGAGGAASAALAVR